MIGKMAYENFITDMTQWREFIDKYPESMINDDGVYEAIFVTTKNADDGVLVVADGEEFPKWCAYWPGR